MEARWVRGEHFRDDFAGELADAALAVTARHDVRGNSVDRELELWHSLSEVVRDVGLAQRRDDVLSVARKNRITGGRS